MLKRISSTTALKTGVLALLAASTMSLKAAKQDNNYVTEPNKTELISKEGAAALKANSIQVTTQNKAKTNHYEKLDETIRKFIEDEDDKKDVEWLINNLYDRYGTALGTAFLQHELDKRMLYTFLNGNTKLLKNNDIAPEFADRIDSYGDDFYKTVTPISDDVFSWLLSEYSPYVVSKLNFDHKPTTEETLKEIKYIIENESNFNDEEKTGILASSEMYHRNVLNNKTDDESLSKLIAYIINEYDKNMIAKKLVAAGIYAEDYFNNYGKNVMSYYKDWMNNISPNKYDK